jgi:hypothetical protein
MFSSSSSDFTTPGKRTVTAGGFKVEIDLTSKVLAVHTPITYGSDEAQLSPTLGRQDSTEPVSAAVLVQKAKVFDDGLYAAIEIAAQEGAGRHGGKAALLASVGRALAGANPAEAGQAQDIILGAARLGHVDVTDIPDAVEARVQRAVEEFLADEGLSKPISFYTWSAELVSVFQQDRMLQRAIADPRAIEAVAAALRADPAARTAYEVHLRLVSRLTNRFGMADLRKLLQARDPRTVDPPKEGICFLPPSVAHETEVGKELYGDRPIPGGFVLSDELIRRIRSREIDLQPHAESGWYDYQWWSLEPLVVPERMAEAERLEFNDEYKKLLLELFKGLLTLTRETHIKQLMTMRVGAAMGTPQFVSYIAPALSAEPLVTFYLRRALSYRFVRGVLDEAFGPGQLEGFHRLTQAGPAPASLAEELSGMEMLFLGAHVTVSRQLGLAPDAAAGSDLTMNEAANRFESWICEQHMDPDLGLDLRAMVPVYYDIERRKTKVWVFLGWSYRPISVTFARPPKATVLNHAGEPVLDPRIGWDGLHGLLAYPVTAELYVDRILDRDEFRSLCDACKTRSKIIASLTGSPDGQGKS